MSASKSVIVLLALAAVAAAVEVPVKRQIYAAVAPLPYARAVHPIGDDGSWAPGKYDPIAAPILPYAAHIAAPYAAHIAAPYAAHIAAPYAAAPVAHWAHPVSDDGSYWAGKYGPEWQ